MNRILVLAARAAAVVALLVFTRAAWSQADYPNRPVRLVSGYAAGGTTSLVGRMIGQRLAEQWGQQWVLDNRPGGGTLIGGEIVAKAPPDGYTLMLIDSVHVLAPLLLKAPYDPIKDFTAIGTVASSELVLVVHPSMPVKNYAEFIGYVKARPGKLQYATPAMAGAQHLATEVFGSPAQASTWLTRPHPSLDGETPLKRARTPWGMSKVQSILVALRYGAAA